MKRQVIWILSAVIAAGLAVAAVKFFGQAPPVVVSTQPAATQVASTLATAPAFTQPAIATIKTYGDLLHRDLKHYPVTQPWAVGVDLSEAAHVVLYEPTYVCSHGDLWITHPDADALPAVLARASTETEHVTSDAIACIIWTINRKGQWQAAAIRPDGVGWQYVEAKSHQPIGGGRKYQWDRALTWDDNDATRLIVPSDRGVSIFTLGSTITEDYQLLVNDKDLTVPAPQFLFDMQGLLAWIPADGAFAGPSTVARFLDGKWQTLDTDDWKKPIIHLVPMLDGSVLQIRHGDADAVDLAMVPLDAMNVDNDAISKLVDQLADEDADKRQQAYDRLTEYGPGIFPTLEKLQADALPEAQARIHELLQGKLTAKLGGMEVNDNRLTVNSRLADGGVVLFAPEGISIPQEGDEPRVVSPAYLVIRPGRAVEEVPEELINKLTADAAFTQVRDEWVVKPIDDGVARYLPPDRLATLTDKGEERFTQVAAIDSRGRWLLKTAASTQASTNPSNPNAPDETLLLDPTVPNPSPKLALWLIDNGVAAGWDAKGWPVIQRAGDVWEISPTGWRLMEQTEKLLTESPALTEPTTQASTQSSTQPTVTGDLLLKDAAGDRYYDGKVNLTRVAKDGTVTIFPLPDNCAGSADNRAWLAESGDGALFLLNDADRLIRLRFTPDEADPFTIEGIFGENVPHFTDIMRMWADPNGRIDIAYDKHRLAIVFPRGQVPPEIADKILPQDLRVSEP